LGDAVYLGCDTGNCQPVMIRGTRFQPFNKEQTAVIDGSWLATVGGCAEHPCEAGFSCSYQNYSLWCDRCPDKTVGQDGLICLPCEAGKGPSPDRTRCESCTGDNSYSASGVCEECGPETVPVLPGRRACAAQFRCKNGYECRTGACKIQTDCSECGAGERPCSAVGPPPMPYLPTYLPATKGLARGTCDCPQTPKLVAVPARKHQQRWPALHSMQTPALRDKQPCGLLALPSRTRTERIPVS
jgi:hypothetical protein